LSELGKKKLVTCQAAEAVRVAIGTLLGLSATLFGFSPPVSDSWYHYLDYRCPS
jgi:hypothetical protein